MMYLFNLLSQMMKSKKGQGMVEYGLIIGLIAIVVIGALFALAAIWMKFSPVFQTQLAPLFHQQSKVTKQCYKGMQE